MSPDEHSALTGAARSGNDSSRLPDRNDPQSEAKALDARVVGGTVVSGSGSGRLDLGIADGRIVGLYEPGQAPDARESIQADGLLVLPGIVDAHFHCRAPGHPEREDFDSGTQAAAAGGATTVFEMPIADPGVHTGAILRERRALGERAAHVDFALWGGGGAETDQDILDMAAEGAIGYKIFLHSAPAGREREFEGLTAVDNASLFRALRRIKRTGLPTAIHCEDDKLISAFTEELRARGETGPAAHEQSRQGFVEAVAVSNVLLLAEAIGARVHFPHISTSAAVEMIGAAKRRGQPVSLETCPHYLLFERSIVDQLGPFAKINPPIRPMSDQQALWAGIREGVVDIVASDHAPYTVEEKEQGWQDIFKAPSGSPSVETMGPALFDRALAGDLTLSRAVQLLSERPAALFSIADRKGFLRPGADADFLLFDPSASWTVQAEKLFTRSRGSARLFEGRTLRGRLLATYVRGAPVYRDGQIANAAGSGWFVSPAH